MKHAAWLRRLRVFFLTRAPKLFARWCTLDDRELGEWGEEIAARHLRRRGWRILGRRLATSVVEIDILALDRGTIVCVEVKTGRLEPMPRPRGKPEALDAIAMGQLRWRPGRRCDASRIDRLRRVAHALQRGWTSEPCVLSVADAQQAGLSRARERQRRAADPDPRTIPAPRDSLASPSFPPGSQASARASPRRRAQVDLIEVILPTTTRQPRIVHHSDVRRPLG